MKVILQASTVLFTICATTAAICADQPKFETASVKPADHCSFENSVDPGMVALNGDPLSVLLTEAFNVKRDQIVGPSWLDSDCVSVNAKMPEGATKDQLPEMFQALLVERFKLAFHKETRQRSGYALVVDKNGPKLKQSDLNSPSARAHAGQVTFGAGPGVGRLKGAMTIARLAHFLSGRLDAPVQDLTGLAGTYDVDLSWVRDPTEKIGPYGQQYAATHPGSTDASTGLPPPTVDIFTSIRESLGLRLESRKLQVEMVVIDHIERVPTSN